jgi:D-alanyl-D-alanine carboxypeptidase
MRGVGAPCLSQVGGSVRLVRSKRPGAGPDAARHAWFLGRVVVGAVVALGLVGSLPAAAHHWHRGSSHAAAYAPVFEWIVLDAATGQVLGEQNADELTYPASLTKMMTLYLTFEALNQGRISLDQRFIVSANAAGKEPSKLGLTPGETVSVHDLILGIVTKSANDAAVVLAEGLAGSEPAFAVQMNREARALGMLSTNFRNASGLPNRYNYTTARDMAKLALALYRTFPKEYAYFSTEKFTYDGRTYINHNHLMEEFQGMDGIKTGYINASGFNLAASAVRHGERLVGVIMGGRTATSRDSEMAELLDDAFAHRNVPAAMIASNRPIIRHDAIYRRAEDSFSPIAHAEAATPAPHRVAQMRYHHARPIRVARRHYTRHHVVSRRHVVRLAAIQHHHYHHPVARVRHTPTAHHYAARHRHHITPHRRYARAEVRSHHRHVARVHHHHVTTRRYAKLRRYHASAPRHFAQPVYATSNWVCSTWAKAHHRCPGHKLALPRDAAMRAATNNPTGTNSSS